MSSYRTLFWKSSAVCVTVCMTECSAVFRKLFRSASAASAPMVASWTLSSISLNMEARTMTGRAGPLMLYSDVTVNRLKLYIGGRGNKR